MNILMCRFSLCIFIMLFLSTTSYSCSDCVEITGKVSIKGNEPHTVLVITTKDKGDLVIVGKLKQKIWDNYQQQYIKVKGRFVKGVTSFGQQIEVIEIVAINVVE